MKPSRLMTSSRQDHVGMASVIASLFAMAWLGGAANAALLVQYKFDEPSGNAINSGTLGATADGTFSSGATRTTSTPGGISAGALDTTATTSSMLNTAGVITGLNNLSAVTVTAWVDFQTASIPTYGTFVSNQKYGTGGFAFYHHLNSSSAFSLVFNVGSIEINNGSTVNADHVWTFIAATYDGTNTKFYTGGVASAVAQLGSPVASVYGNTGTTTNPLSVGHYDPALGLGDFTPGWLDDVRIYSTVLDASALNTVRLENLTAVPEPATVLLLALAGCVRLRRRR